ncbi:MAG: YitT family protein [Filifactoraceae bacterium]
MKILVNKKNILDILFILIGCTLCAYSVTAILEPTGLVTSGYTGFSLVLQKIFGLRYTYFYYIFTIVTLILAFIFLGKRELFKIMTVSLIYPNVLFILDKISLGFVSTDLVICTIYFGLLNGIGVGLVLKRGFTFGGTDTLSKILQKKIFKYFTLNQILLVIDALVILSSYFVAGGEIALYSLLNHFIVMRVINYIMYEWGSTLYKMEVISEHYIEISNYIMSLGRGVTMYEIIGGYTGKKRIQITSIVAPKESILIKNKIAELDHDAFVEFLPILSVYGAKGKRFMDIKSQKL